MEFLADVGKASPCSIARTLGYGSVSDRLAYSFYPFGSCGIDHDHNVRGLEQTEHLACCTLKGCLSEYGSFELPAS